MSTPEDFLRYNQQTWNRQVERGNPWTVPVSSEAVARARNGDWSIVLTPTKPVPSEWFPLLVGLDVLCLAAAGDNKDRSSPPLEPMSRSSIIAPPNLRRTASSPNGMGL